MGSRELIILSLLFVSSTVFGAKTATDYANQGSQYYVFGQDDSAEAEVDTGLSNFPNDPELQALAGLIKKKPPQKQDQQNQQQQQQQQKDQQQQQQKDQQQQQQQDQKN